MSRCKLIPDLRYSNWAHLNLRKPITFFICRQDHWINHSTLWMLHLSWTVFSGLKHVSSSCTWWSCRLISIYRLLDETCFANNYVISVHDWAWSDNPIYIKLIVSTNSSTLSTSVIWSFKNFVFILWIWVSSKKCWSKQTSVNTWLVEHYRVFLVVSCVACNCYNCVTSCWQFFEM